MPFLRNIRILLLFFPTLLFGIGASVMYENESSDQARKEVEKTLNKIGAGYSKYEGKEGFDYYYTDTFFSPFAFDIYVGSFNKKDTLIRIDAPDRMSYALADVFAQEKGQKGFSKTYSTKWVILGDLLTLVSPGLGHMYVNWNSPFASPGSFLTSLLYLGIDGVLLWVGGKTFFTHGFDPFDRGIIATSILMGSYRLYFLGKFHLRMIAQNRLVELGYKFRF